MKKQIVVTTINNENIDWIKETGIPYLNYDKTNNYRTDEKGNVDLIGDLKYICGWTYTLVKHIIENYDCLADYTLFTKSNPFKNPNEKCWSDVQVNRKKLLNKLKQKTYDKKLILCGNFNYECDIKGQPGKWLHVQDFEKGMNELIKNLLNYKRSLKTFKYTAGGVMIVPKELIHNRSLDFYKKVMFYLDGVNDEISKIGGNLYADCLERLWILIFKAQKKYEEL